MRPRRNLLRRMVYGVCSVVKISLIGNYNGTTLSGSLSARKSISLSTTATRMVYYFA